MSNFDRLTAAGGIVPSRASPIRRGAEEHAFSLGLTPGGPGWGDAVRAYVLNGPPVMHDVNRFDAGANSEFQRRPSGTRTNNLPARAHSEQEMSPRSGADRVIQGSDESAQGMNRIRRPTPPFREPTFEEEWQALLAVENRRRKDGTFKKSRVGAIGPAQILPKYGSEYAQRAGLKWDEERAGSDEEYNLALGRAYYAALREIYDAPAAAAAYNYGPYGFSTILGHAVDAGHPDDWEQYLPKETRDHVRKFRDLLKLPEGDSPREPVRRKEVPSASRPIRVLLPLPGAK